MNRARRLVLSGAALTALLAAVAVASHAHRPGGGSGGGPSHVSRLLFEYTASILFVLFPVGALVVIWVLSMGRRQKLLQEPWSLRRNVVLLLLVTVLIVPVTLTVRHFVKYDGGGIQAPAAPLTTKGGAGGGRAGRQQEAQFQWVPALVVGSLLFGVVGVAAIAVVARRRHGAAWEREAELAAALDEVLADTLDDLRAERDPRRAVIRTYARLERTFAAHDVTREPHETAREFVDRALDRLGVSSFAVRRLTLLYERAKFSSHEIDARMKDDAIEALAGLRAELEADTKAAA
ncbi:MAG TPA: DUF4129 domain-containing protein [Gaiellaceae bacterium]|nr:DUF4129 domain-containing protein [Gaiellaceae bacterium]